MEKFGFHVCICHLQRELCFCFLLFDKGCKIRYGSVERQIRQEASGAEGRVDDKCKAKDNNRNRRIWERFDLADEDVEENTVCIQRRM